MTLTPLQQALTGACCLAASAVALLTPAVVEHQRAAHAPAPAVHMALTGPARHAHHVSAVAVHHVGGMPEQHTGVAQSMPTASAANPTAPSATVSPITAPVSVSASRPAPQAVGDLRLVTNTASRFTVSWSASDLAQQYRFTVNGVSTLTTATTASAAWPSSGANAVVQVTPIGSDGSVGATTSLVIVPPAPSEGTGSLPAQTNEHSGADGTSIGVRDQNGQPGTSDAATPAPAATQDSDDTTDTAQDTTAQNNHDTSTLTTSVSFGH